MDLQGTASAPPMWRASVLQGFTIGATDGDIGQVDDLYFDDESWTVRSLVVDTSGWLTGRKVLVSPIAVHGVDFSGRRLLTDFTRAKVESSPDIDTARPVSRQREAEWYQYYGYPLYWSGPYRWGPAAQPSSLARMHVQPPGEATYETDPHLRSVNEVTNYGIQAIDGELGHVEDFFVEQDSWAIRYVLVDPRNWWPGKYVLVATAWVTAVDWNGSVVRVDLSKGAVRNAPEYDPAAWLDRSYESRLHDHYLRPGYWTYPPETWGRLRRPAA
jgi:hypothetical protein